jgi:signal transduction histidine kinase/CheY-like chemotaxis protein
MAILPEVSAVSPQRTEDEVDDARRGREFYHYFQPDNLIQPHLRRRPSVLDISSGEVPDLSRALSPIAQLTALRMNCRKTMINVMDRDVMYFLSEATKISTEHGEATYEFVEDPIFLACSSLPLKGRICELTLRLDNSEDSAPLPMFVINDLTQSQFAHMEIITGPPYYRFYAGVPIKTRDGINIGSLAVMDTRARPNGLTSAEQSFLATTAGQIMLFLETNRQAIEGRQSRRMAEGLEAFIAGRKSIHDDKTGYTLLKKRSKTAYGLAAALDGDSSLPPPKPLGLNAVALEHVDDVSTSGQSSEAEDMPAIVETDGESRTHTKTFARAANLLRECLGNLGEDGAVVFLNIGSSLNELRRKRGATLGNTGGAMNGGVQRPVAKPSIVSYSTHTSHLIPEKGTDEKPKTMEGEMLKDLIGRYPGGRLFTFDASTSSSSEDDTNLSKRYRRTSDQPLRHSRRKQMELSALHAMFPAAGQVLFTPLWDATTGSFAYACFVATAVETRSFNPSIELPFLNSFCNTLMGECSRLDTILADKQKSDFVGTISHEMRSPLHGLLASVEFLAETELSSFQRNLISTIDSCGRTLLDTINHVLDFSKINSFQKHWQASNKKHSHGSRRYTYLGPENTSKPISQGAPALLQLLGVVDVSAVLEEVVDGLVLGHTYTSGLDLTDMSRESRGRGKTEDSEPPHSDAVKITLDVQKADWTFLTQPGAVRRIIMNLTGNAIKYTNQGSINVRLQLLDAQDDGSGESMVLTVADTGKGISQEFLNSKLFVPFAQENALAPGTGLGLSIVRSIVLMLGGTIDVKSKLQEGTTVEVTLPVKRPLPGQTSTQTTPYSDSAAGANSTGGSSVDNSLLSLRDQWSDATITLWQSEPQIESRLRRIVRSYVQDWYGLQFVDQRLCDSSSAVIVEEQDLDPLLNRLASTPGRRPALVVMCSVLSRHTAALVQSLEARICSAVEFVSEPCGPHKLARSVRLALERQTEVRTQFSRSLGQKPIFPVVETDVSPTVAGSESMTENMAELDLNLPGETDDAKVVQATETFAASQASHNAQMALHDPITALRTPRNHVSEGDAFPFPMHAQEDSRMRRESDRRLNSLEPTSDGVTPRSNALGHSQSPLPKPTPSKTDPRVLLVDDNKINLRLLETFLKNKRMYGTIEQAENGQQAVDAVKAAKEPFDIIFMDISMPVMDGFEATRSIRELEDVNGTKPGAMIIALTGLASARDQGEVFNCGCDIYMTKPVSFKEVGKLLNNWEAHRSNNATSGPD